MTAPYPLTQEGVAAALAALGSTPAAVAARLIERGHFGIPGDCTDCPVVHYLEVAFPQAHRVTVSEGAVAVYPAPGSNALVALTPEPVARFIERFDRDDFQELRDFRSADRAGVS